MSLPMLQPHASTEEYLPLFGNQQLSQEDINAGGGVLGFNSSYVSGPTSFGALAQMDLANGRLGNRVGLRNGAGSPRMPSSILEPHYIDVFFPFQLTDLNSVKEAINSRHPATCTPYSYSNGFEAVGEDYLEVLGRGSPKWQAIPLLDDDRPRDDHSFEDEDEGPAPLEQCMDAMEIDEPEHSTGKSGGAPKKEEIVKYVRPPNGPELTEEMIRANNYVLTEGVGSDRIGELGGISLTRADLTKLMPSEWLEDPIVDFYFQMIKERNNGPESGGIYPRVYVFPSTFYALLGSARGLEKVREAVDNDNIFSYEMLLIPVCRSLHWRLVVVNVRQRSICSYNSLKTPDLQIRKNIERFLNTEEDRLNWNRMNRNQDQHLPPREPWTHGEGKAPQQTNVDDCGVFVIQFANYLSKRQPFNFTQENMNYFRQIVMHECRHGRFL